MNIELHSKVYNYKIVEIHNQSSNVKSPQTFAKLTKNEAQIFNYAFALNNLPFRYKQHTTSSIN
jgi:hypothetical protein